MSECTESQSEDGRDDGVELAEGVRIPDGELRYSFSRSSGPGGQSVNKLNTRAELRVALSAIEGMDERALDRLRRLAGQRLTRDDELVIHAQTHRSQLGNRRASLDRLCGLVKEAMKKPKVRKRRGLSRAMIERRLRRKRERSEKKTRRAWKSDQNRG